MSQAKPEKLVINVRYWGERASSSRREPLPSREASSVDRSLTPGLTARELIDMARAARTRTTTA